MLEDGFEEPRRWVLEGAVYDEYSALPNKSIAAPEFMARLGIEFSNNLHRLFTNTTGLMGHESYEELRARYLYPLESEDPDTKRFFDACRFAATVANIAEQKEMQYRHVWRLPLNERPPDELLASVDKESVISAWVRDMYMTKVLGTLRAHYSDDDIRAMTI
jgi:hypothetical protein